MIMTLVKIAQKMYGDYKCSCGCGKVLTGMCYGVGDEEDINGYDWRMFTEQCWQGMTMFLDEIYENYPPSPINDDIPEYEYDDSAVDCYEYQ